MDRIYRRAIDDKSPNAKFLWYERDTWQEVTYPCAPNTFKLVEGDIKLNL